MTQTVIEPLTPEFFDPSCPVEAVPVLGSRKWSWKIMRCLEGGPRRFSELKVPLHGITPKVLTESLRAMERDGAVSRTDYAENPPRVEYGLTPLGRSLLGPMDATCAWTREHLAHLLAARAAYEAGAEARAGVGAGRGGGSGGSGAPAVTGGISAHAGGITAGDGPGQAAILDA